MRAATTVRLIPMMCGTIALMALLAVPAAAEPVAIAPEATVYPDLIAPILKQRCSSCHGDRKQKGDLRLDSLDAIRAGGKSGPAVIPGTSSESLLMQRLDLPLDDLDHMPPEEKTQPTETEVNLLRWWLDAGMPDLDLVADQDLPDGLVLSVDSAPPGAPPPPEIREEDWDALRAASQMLIVPLSQDDPTWLQVSTAGRAAQIGDDAVRALLPIAPRIAHLSLSRSQITDAASETIAQMQHIRWLDLDRTAVSDVGVTALAGLSQLQHLNLSGTSVTDEVLDTLRQLTQLHRVYVGNTRVTAHGEAQLEKHLNAREDIEDLQRQVALAESKLQAARSRLDRGIRPPLPRDANAAIPPMQLEAPIETWDEAVQLGNGLLGGLLWGSTNAIHLSLDRGDLWDERLPEAFAEDGWNFSNLRELVAAKNQAEINRLFDNPYNEVAPTKLPGGRLVLTLPPDQHAQSFALDLRQAEGTVTLPTGRLETFFHAREPVAMLRVDHTGIGIRFDRPQGLDRLGYAPAQFGEDEGMHWMVQEAAQGLSYAVVVASRVVGEQTELAITIAATTQDDDPLAAGKQRVQAALASGYETMRATHRTWWDTFWDTSMISIPDARLQQHYQLVKYFYGAASRPDAPPMPLQGVWTRDDGNLPPWKGDYHHDLNTQMTYLPYHVAGLTDAGLSFINMCWDRLPVYRQFAQDFFGVEGAAIASVATLAGMPTGGWTQYSLTAPNGLWVGHSFYLHWRYTMDEGFLRTRAYPWLSEITTGIVNLLEERDGKLYLPLSSSPEIHNNSLRAWLPPNSNYDLALMHWAFEALTEMAGALGLETEAGHWRELRGKLDPLTVDDEQVLMFSRNEPFTQSHRHHSHTMAIHPLGRMHIEQGDAERTIIQATLDRMIDKGTQAWTGYSFSWFAGMLARCGRPDEALRFLSDYERAFTLRNGFHANGDQLGIGLSGFRYRPFTLEGNFLAMDAVHEMILQSWAPDQDGPHAYQPLIRLFPSTPSAWEEASFEKLRAEGGYLISARRKDQATTWFRIQATRDGTVRLLDNFQGRTPRFTHGKLTLIEGVYQGDIQPGDIVEAVVLPQ